MAASRASVPSRSARAWSSTVYIMTPMPAVMAPPPAGPEGPALVGSVTSGGPQQGLPDQGADRRLAPGPHVVAERQVDHPARADLTGVQHRDDGPVRPVPLREDLHVVVGELELVVL